MSLFLPSKNVLVKSAEEALWVFMGRLSVADVQAENPGGANKSLNEFSSDKQPPQIERVQTGHSPLHALIIGIDRFASPRIKELHGAVNDADAISTYLEQDLRTPSAQIVNLRNEEATRARIIAELRSLRVNPNIKSGDPILIYFAAHGTSSIAPEGWIAGAGKIQLIVPHDCFMPDPETGDTILPIPDRTLGALLDKLADVDKGGKGDNITVIFDCCNSGSGTRISDYERTRIPRGFSYEDPLPDYLDKEIWAEKSGERAIKPTAGFAHSGLRSHVFLAACSATEIAQEEKGRGVFTSALLNVLRVSGTTRLTYKDLMLRLPDLPAQNPQCEGINIGRVLFNARAPDTGRALYRVKQKGGGYILEAGSAHGITLGSLFDVYPTREFKPGDVPLGTLKSGSVGPFQTDLSFLSSNDIHFVLPNYEGFALLTQAGQEEALRLHVPLKDGLQCVFEALALELENRRPGQRPILLVDEAKAEITVDIESDGQISFNLTDGLITGYGLKRLYYSVQPDAQQIYPVLQAAAHFFWHLRRSPDKGQLRNKIDIAFHRVQVTGRLNDELEDIYEPEDENLVHDGVVDLEADETKYGVTIKNKISVPIYISLFFFDCSDLSIAAYYLQPNYGPTSDPTLPPFGMLPIGYGDSGGSPHQYFLRDEQDMDVGFLKLFLSTRPIDLENVAQKSPWEDAGPKYAKRQANRGTVPTWDAVTIAMLQRKPGSKLSDTE